MIEKSKDAKFDLGELHLKMQMNIRMYEPSLVPFLQKLESELRKCNKLRFAVGDCYKKTGQASEVFDAFNKQLGEWQAASDALKAAIIERGATIASENGQITSRPRQLIRNL